MNPRLKVREGKLFFIRYSTLVFLLGLPFALGLTISESIIFKCIGVAIFAVQFYPIYIKIKYPVLYITHSNIEYRNMFGYKTEVPISSTLEVLYGDKDIVFKNLENEIILEKGDFNKQEWKVSRDAINDFLISIGITVSK